MEADPRTEQQLRDEIESLGKELADACRERAGRARRPRNDAGYESAKLWRSMLDAMKDGSTEGMQYFDSEIEKLIRSGVVDIQTGLSYATNAGNMRLQLADLLEEPTDLPSLVSATAHNAGRRNA